MIVKGYVSMNIIHVHYMSNIQKSIDFINKAYDKLTYFDCMEHLFSFACY